MLLTDVDPDEAAARSDGLPEANSVRMAATAGFQALLAATAGLLLTCGLSLVLWAVTPASGAGAWQLLRSGVVAFGAANGMTVAIGGSMLTLTPLMLTAVAVALLMPIGRVREVVTTRSQELITTATAAAVYAVVVTVLGVGVGSAGALRADQWWRPGLLAVVVVGSTTLVRGTAWRTHLIDRLPLWVPTSVRLGAVGAAALVAGGAITLVIALVESFGDSIRVQTIAAPSAGGGFGMALLGIAFLPNAVVAASGYATGVGFSVGSGTYSLFGSTRAEMPAIPLLTATPDGATPPRPTLLLLLIPVLVAILVGRGVVRRLDRRRDRLLAVGGAGIFAAVIMVVLAVGASGGVTGGEWSTSGVRAGLFGVVVAVALGGIGAAIAGIARVPVHAQSHAEDGAATEGLDEAEAEPVEAEVEPTEAEAEPVEAEVEPTQAEAEPVEAELEPVEAEVEPTAAAEVEPEEAAAPREEDVIAAAEAETDEDLVAELDQPPAPRQVG